MKKLKKVALVSGILLMSGLSYGEWDNKPVMMMDYAVGEDKAILSIELNMISLDPEVKLIAHLDGCEFSMDDNHIELLNINKKDIPAKVVCTNSQRSAFLIRTPKSINYIFNELDDNDITDIKFRDKVFSFKNDNLREAFGQLGEGRDAITDKHLKAKG